MMAREPHPTVPGVPGMPFGRTALAAAVAGTAAGLLFSIVQQGLLVPLIQEAESLEAGHAVHPAGILRTVLTVVFDCLAGFGFGLLLAAGMGLRRHRGWSLGLRWGAAGWLCFSLAPALGLPPELPGAAAGLLGPRQAWWVIAAAGSAVGLTLLVFGRAPLPRLAGVLLAALPHLAGAPGGGWQALPPMGRAFAAGALIAAAVFWAALGAGLGLLLARLPAR